MKESVEFVAVIDEREVGVRLVYDADVETYEVKAVETNRVFFSGDFSILVAVIRRALELWHGEDEAD